MRKHGKSVAPLLIFGLLACRGASTSSDGLGSTPYRFDEGEVEWSSQLARVEARIADAEARAAAQPQAWMPLDEAASHWGLHARLTGSVDDYIEARARLDEAFARAPEGGGPWMGLAQFEFSVHRLAESEAALERAAAAILIDDDTRAAIEGLRGDIALQRGQMADAHAALELAETLNPSSQSAARLALWSWRSGDFDGADQWYTMAASRHHAADPYADSWFDLQRGLVDLDRGAYEDSLTHYLDANRSLSGWYLIEEHAAEILVRSGRVEEARFIYEDIVERTALPEFMDALAGLHADAGESDKAEVWAERARVAYEARLATLPEAATGHAMDHYLEWGPPARARELAAADFAARPNPDSESAYALALLQVGDTAAAREHADAAAAGAWRSYDIYSRLAEVYEGLGDASAATDLSARACDIAPLRCGE